jgi:type I restriction enzyme M protein
MLDADTKQYINKARDILVGKVPNPINQVDMITTAMIYKFMDDMDCKTIEYGGQRKFFTGSLQDYTWSNLLSPRHSNQNRLNLYAEALNKLPLAKQIPALFRDIFKDASLPFRDGETLSLFLNEIKKFSYDNSEVIGNAFEYLLSIMGSQGDAGQFRTPRHIIDFIVDVVRPVQTDKILDPACGTAGFLISAYKYILKTTKEKSLTHGVLDKLTNNIIGYDIDPTMVKLSLVNLYLHSFLNPQIYEYDTLTSEQRWEDRFDVILANPPFMTPKGGIQPHNRFSIQANRSEVLFVDYIAEHLNLGGRAGVIVPEGIIFQSNNAYKKLRKMLVDDNYLYAVVSLPSGVFQPYSGVKTSILFLDKRFSKKIDSILFVKIDNDGFDLGAQRRPIAANDLPEALTIINDWKADKNVSKYPRVIIAEKNKIAENGDYNLSAERYRIIEKQIKQKWKTVKLGDIAEIIRGVTFSKSEQRKTENEMTIRVATTKAAQESGIVEKDLYFIDKSIVKDKNKYLQEGDILISTANSLNLLGRTTFVSKLTFECTFGAFMTLIRTNSYQTQPIYVLHCLKSELAKKYFISVANTTTNISNLSFVDLSNFSVPLPPFEVQEQIVAEIEIEQKAIEACKELIKIHEKKIADVIASVYQEE